MHFVVSVGPDKADPELRKLIRSHVMLGKNKGKTLPSRRKAPKRVQTNGEESTSYNPPSMIGNMSQHPQPDGILKCDVYIIPRKFASDVATLTFADVVNPRLVDVILQFSQIAKQILFPLESCIFFDRRAEQWIAPLATDPAFLHVMILTTQQYFDTLSQKNKAINKKTIPNHLKALKLLRERFDQDDDTSKISLTTIAAIMALAGYGIVNRDFKSARCHIEGLVKIVNLRGGFATFEGATKIYVEVLRCDIMLAICSNTEPLFFADLSIQPLIPYPDLGAYLGLLNLSASICQFQLPTMDDELMQCWKVMAEFSIIINVASCSKQLITMETFRDTMGSVVYRLLKRRFNLTSSDEAIRVSLLAYSYSVLFPWKVIGLSHLEFDATIQHSLLGITSQGLSPQLSLWMLMIGAVSVFDIADHNYLLCLLGEQIEICAVQSWKEMQELMGSFMWIGLVHDMPGKIVFDLASKCAVFL